MLNVHMQCKIQRIIYRKIQINVWMHKQLLSPATAEAQWIVTWMKRTCNKIYLEWWRTQHKHSVPSREKPSTLFSTKKHTSYYIKIKTQPTQPPTLSGMGNESSSLWVKAEFGWLWWTNICRALHVQLFAITGNECAVVSLACANSCHFWDCKALLIMCVNS